MYGGVVVIIEWYMFCVAVVWGIALRGMGSRVGRGEDFEG